MLPDNTTTVKNDTTQVKKRLAVGTKVTYKKAVYKITRSTSKSAEVTLLYIKSKKVKNSRFQQRSNCLMAEKQK
ncbi:MAG: hypothetical protein ACLUTO_05815 [Anaerostipes sp.]